MLARDLAEAFPVVGLDDDALDAVRLLASGRLPGIVVANAQGRPQAILPGSQVLRFVLPLYVQEDPSLARVYDEEHADRIASRLAGRPVRDVLPRSDQELAVVDEDATAVEVAAVMARLRSPPVVVQGGAGILGVVTAAHLLEHLVPPP
ncbi:MAG: CBS domain-containing protein [Carbonactinosporaceae bacterium]